MTAWCIRELYFVFLEPWLVRLGLVKLGFGDATYGREAIPYSPSELDYIYDNPDVKVTRRRVFFSGNEPILDLKLQGTWVDAAIRPRGQACDIMGQLLRVGKARIDQKGTTYVLTPGTRTSARQYSRTRSMTSKC